MRFTTLMYLLGMFLLLLGERMIGGDDIWRWGLDGIGLACLLGTLGRLAMESRAAQEGQQAGFRLALGFAGLGLLSLCVYSLSTEWGLEFMGYELLSGVPDVAESAQHYQVFMTCFWMLLWLAGTLPFIAADWVLYCNPMAVDNRAMRQASLSALSTALLLSALFPLNYWVSQQDPSSWVEDHSYFKAPAPGDQAQLLVENLDEPVTAYAFFPEADVVRAQVERYLKSLEGGLFAVEILDQAMEPTLSEELQIRDNGSIAFVRGEGSERQIERLKLGLGKKRRDLSESTRSKIRSLDSEVLQKLRKIASSKRTVYVTSGHGELHWGAQSGYLDRISTLKKMFSAYNYQVKSLGPTDGLTEAVPEDAAMVLVLGAYLPLEPSEIASLHAYREQGGSLLIALRPALEQTPDLSGLLEPLGLGFDGNQVLAHANSHSQLTGGAQDQLLIYTQSYTTHSAVSLLHKNKDGSSPLKMPFSGVLSPIEGSEVTPQVAIKSMAETWAETGLSSRTGFKFDPEEESKQIFNLAYAVSGPVEGAALTEASVDQVEEWRVFVTAGANWMSDPLITGAGGQAYHLLGNTQLIQDLLGWLGRDTTLQGSVNTEEDRKVEHTKGAAGWIFYGTTFIVPFVFLFLGLARLSIRRKGGVA